MNRRSLANVAGVAVGITGLAFVASRIHRDWDQVTKTLHAARPGWMFAAFVAGIASMTFIGGNWLSLIRRFGHAAPPQRGLSWFFVGQLGKYVPGGIWPVVGQAELAARGGVDRRSAYSATASSMAFTLLGALSTVAIFGFASPYEHRLVALLLATAVALVVLSLAVPRIRAVLARVMSAATHGRVELPEASIVAIYTVRHLPVWAMFGTINICVFLAVGGSLEPGLTVDLLYASSLSWIAGFVVIGVPGGIGVRETAFVALMSGPLGATLALSIAVTSRLVTVSVDLVTAAAAASIARFSQSPEKESVPSHVRIAPAQADHPNSLLQRGSDLAADGGRPSP